LAKIRVRKHLQNEGLGRAPDPTGGPKKKKGSTVNEERSNGEGEPSGEGVMDRIVARVPSRVSRKKKSKSRPSSCAYQPQVKEKKSGRRGKREQRDVAPYRKGERHIASTATKKGNCDNALSIKKQTRAPHPSRREKRQGCG